MDQGQHSQLHNPYSAALNIDTTSGDRFPQWSIQETRELLIIRADLDGNFMETKRNKLLWELISSRMKEKGYSRSADQCKCKWKNLVTRFKGCEAMEAEGMRQQQFPFYNDLQTIFATRMQRMLWLEAEGGGASASISKKRKKAAASKYSSSEEDDENEESEGEKAGVARRKKIIKGKETGAGTSSSNVSSIINGVKGIMEDYMRQQIEMEMQWIKAYEAREEERRAKEIEWRQKMEALENERIMMERRWREREEQRRTKEEARAERRDALITALLNKLRREDM